MGNTVVHIHNIDGHKGVGLTAVGYSIPVEGVNFLEDMGSVLTPMVSAIRRDQWVKHTIQVVGGSGGGTFHRRDDASHRREFATRRGRFVYLRKSIEVGTFHFAPDDAPVEVVGDNAPLIENSHLSMNKLSYVTGGVLIKRSIYRRIGEDRVDRCVIVLRVHDNHTTSLVRLADGKRRVGSHGTEGHSFIPRQIIPNRSFVRDESGSVQLHLLTIEVQGCTSSVRGRPGTLDVQLLGDVRLPGGSSFKIFS
jgi:hypothetical protein